MSNRIVWGQLPSRSSGIYCFSFFGYRFLWSPADPIGHLSHEYSLRHVCRGSCSLFWLQVCWRDCHHCCKATWLWWMGNIGNLLIHCVELWIFPCKLATICAHVLAIWTNLETTNCSCVQCDTWHFLKLVQLQPWTLNEKEECGSYWWLLHLNSFLCSCWSNKNIKFLDTANISCSMNSMDCFIGAWNDGR